MGDEKVLIKMALPNDEAATVCEHMTRMLRSVGLPEDSIISLQLSTGETIKTLEIVAEDVGDVATLYTMIARVG